LPKRGNSLAPLSTRLREKSGKKPSTRGAGGKRRGRWGKTRPASRRGEEIMMRDRKAEDREIVSEIIQFIDQTRYGELVVTIHDSRVVQIEKREKRRFRNDS
jgi:hypothetical protein